MVYFIMRATLPDDTSIQFPQVTVLKASAGSGKTHTLTKRYIQFLLSEKIEKNSLHNILAITFSNNAAKEMKERIVFWLKGVFLGDEGLLNEVSGCVSLEKETLQKRAGERLDEIFGNYQHFQVRTIDSFMTSIFKASALELGYDPDSEILINRDQTMNVAFDLFLRRVKVGSREAAMLEEVADLIEESQGSAGSFKWEPSAVIRDEIKKISSKLSACSGDLLFEEQSNQFEVIRIALQEQFFIILSLVKKSRLKRSKRCSLEKVEKIVKSGRVVDLIFLGLKTLPVNKAAKTDSAGIESYEAIEEEWNRFRELVGDLAEIYAKSYFTPYLKACLGFFSTLDTVKRREGKIFLDDVNKRLAEYIRRETVPDVYFRVGDTIYHYLIDEFQDTSPLQWENLEPLIENTVAQGGSLFVVGDTKQAIYGFRNADYRIMKQCEKENPFPSAQHFVEELGVNFRSSGKVVEFNDLFFKKRLYESVYGETASLSGLTEFEQAVRPGFEKRGFVSVDLLEKEDASFPEREKLLERVASLRERGYRYKDIAVLAPRNGDVTKITAWLSENGIPFISFSSLDIRQRKITGEILALLCFLNSPIDDLSFTTFFAGSIFQKILSQQGIPQETVHTFLFQQRNTAPLYKAFQKEFQGIWKEYFQTLFRSAGYAPTYDLVNEVYRTFALFSLFPEEEATLAKILEVVKDAEDQGGSSLVDFLELAGDRESTDSTWNIDVPDGTDAVRVMTVHKAKGLGFPAVIVVQYEEKNRGFEFIPEKTDQGVRLLKITGKIAQHSSAMGELYRIEKSKEEVNSLNRLYVGLTRATEEMYIIGVKAQTSRAGFPLNLLEGAEELGAPTESEVDQSNHRTSSETIQTLHHQKRLPFLVDPDIGLTNEQTKRGELIHRALFAVDFINDTTAGLLEEVMTALSEEMGVAIHVQKLQTQLLRFMAIQEIREYFTSAPNKILFKEQPFSDSNGNLFRMDRVLVEEERVTVIDFKCGVMEQENTRDIRQLTAYMDILKDVYPGRKVEGVLAYVDQLKVRKKS